MTSVMRLLQDFEKNLVYSCLWSPVLRAISQEIPQPRITKIRFKITYLKFHSDHLPGTNELTRPDDAYMWQWTGSSLVQACSAKPLSEPMLIYCQFYPGIFPHWHDQGSWNPSSSKTGAYLFYLVNIMVADVLATQLSYRFEIWQAHQQQCCRSACQISERSDNSKYKSRGFETLRDLTKRRLFGYWDGAQGISNHDIDQVKPR